MIEREEARRLPVTNGYAGTVPAFSAVVPTAGTRRRLTVGRPTAKDDSGVLVTGPEIMANGGKGHASADWPLWVKYNGTLAAGGELGTAVDSFEMTGGNTGFKALLVDSTNHLALIIPTGGGSAKWKANP